jgi:hypothetical protein
MYSHIRRQFVNIGCNIEMYTAHNPISYPTISVSTSGKSHMTKRMHKDIHCIIVVTKI